MSFGSDAGGAAGPSTPSSTLRQTIAAVLPRCVQQLADSHHVDVPPRSDLHPALQSYLYSFVVDDDAAAASVEEGQRSSFSELFQPFKPDGPDYADSDEEEDNDDGSRRGWSLSQAQAKAASGKLGPEYSRARKGKPCGHVFKRGESVYRCKACGLDETCVFCARCFKASNHEGHEVSFSVHTGGCGCCDCGDHEAWTKDIDCAYHSANVPYPEDGSGDQGHTATPSTQKNESPLLPIPSELLDIVRRRAEEAIEFIVEKISAFPYPSDTAPVESAVLASRPLLPLFSSSSSSSTKSGGSGGAGPWSVIMWNDEKHSYQQVIAQLITSTGCSRSLAYAAATRVDTYGLEVVATSSNAKKIAKVAEVIARIELCVTLCSSEDAVVLEAVGILLDWLQDMAKVRVAGEETLLGRLIGEVVLSNSNLEKLLMNESKLWKRARSSLRGLLMSLLIVGHDCKLQLGRQYASIYPSLISTFLLTDREPDNSVTQFSVQLFSAPSVATTLAREKRFIGLVLQVLYSFFTQQHTDSHGNRTIAMPPSTHHLMVDPDSSSFKHKRYAVVFSDLNHIPAHQGVAAHLVAQADESFPTLVAFLDLFSGMNPLTRASSVHVEYETESWVTAFNLTIQLAKLARVAGSAFHQDQEAIDPQHFCAAVSYLGRIMGIPRQPSQNNSARTRFHSVTFAGAIFNVPEYRVSSAPVSFHHPLHLLYAEIMKNTSLWTRQSIMAGTSGKCASLREMLAFRPTPETHSTVIETIDEVLRVFAMLAQIRSGLWVRNGFGVRAQHLHYREYTLRENTFDQDIYYLQAAFLATDPQLLLVSLIDRFELLSVLDDGQGSLEQGGVNADLPKSYDRAQSITVLEELLYLLIIVFSEPADIEGFDPEQVVRRELTHILLLGPYTYSEVLKNVTERVGEEACFDRVLNEIATFRAPDLNQVTSDVGGVYTLRKENYAQLDPYYYRYNRNQREEAAKILREHFKNEGIFPHRKIARRGGFADDDTFTMTLATKVFVSLLHAAIVFAKQTDDYCETVIDLVLRLAEIAIGEQPEAFASAAQSNPLLDSVCDLKDDSHVKEMRPRIVALMDKMVAVDPHGKLRQMMRRRASPGITALETGMPTAASVAEQKRLAAKARQAAIMQQFAAASKSFLEEHDDSDDDGEDEDEEETARNSQPAEEEVDFDRSFDDDSSMTGGEGKTDRSTIDGDSSDVTATFGDTSRLKRRRRGRTGAIGSCIVCQEDLSAAKPFGSLALIQTSGLIRISPTDERFVQEEKLVPIDLDVDAEAIRPFGLAGKPTAESAGLGGTSVSFPRTTRKGLFASACGHMMHLACFETYAGSIAQRHGQQITREHPENTERKEFICPLCKSLGNILLPLSEDDLEQDMLPPPAGTEAHDAWLLNAMQMCDTNENGALGKALPLLQRSGSGSLRAWRISEHLPTTAASAFGLATISQAERHMLERLVQVVSPLDAESRLLDPGPDERGARVISHELVAYTLSAVEIALRGKPTGTLSADSIPISTARLIRSLLSALNRLVILSTGTPRGIDFARLALLFGVFGSSSSGSNDHILSRSHDHFLNRDPLTLMVEIAAVDPDEFYHFAALAFYGQLVRLSYKLVKQEEDLANAAVSTADGGMVEDDVEPGSDVSSLQDFSISRQEARWHLSRVEVTEQMRKQASRAGARLYRHALPLLRRMAILHNAIFADVKPSSAPASNHGRGGVGAISELSRLLALLRIPHPRDLNIRRHGKSTQKPSSLYSLIESWDEAWLSQYAAPTTTSTYQSGSTGWARPEDKVDLEYPAIYELVGLPKNIDLLIESSVSRRCKRCRKVPTDPAICLLCGELVCQQSYCCMDTEPGEDVMHGECNTHMWECGVSTGIYFLIKRCIIIYLYADKGTFATAPYLDSHGEADPGLRKHRPLFLNQARYDEIRKLWLNQSIATVVARKLEAGTDSGGWSTF